MRTLIIVLGIGAILSMIGVKLVEMLSTPKDASRMDSESLLAEYLCNPVPDGIVGISASGSISYASTNVVIAFSVLNTTVFDQITNDGAFSQMEGPQLTAARDLFRGRLTLIDGVYGKFKNGSVEIIYLAVDRRNMRGCLYYGGG